MGRDNHHPSVTIYHSPPPSTSSHLPRSSFSDSSAHHHHSRTLSTVTRTSVSTDTAHQQQPLLPHTNRSSTISGSTAESSTRLAKRRRHLKKRKKQKKKSQRINMAEKERKLLTTFWNDEPGTDEHSSPRSPSRRLFAVKVVVEAVLGIWAAYGAVRYLYTYGTIQENHVIALALGICSALAASFIVAACVFSSSLSRYLREEGISRLVLRRIRLTLRNAAAILVFAPAVANFALVLIWRNSKGERCNLDVDVVWFLRSGTCKPKAFGVWLGLAILRLVLTLVLIVLYILLSYRQAARPSRKSLEGVASSVNIASETRATRHRSDLSQSTYQSSSGRPLSTSSGPPLTTPPLGLYKHSSSRVSRPVSASTLSQQDLYTDNPENGVNAVTPPQPDYPKRASSPPGLHSIPEGLGTAGPPVSPTIDEQQLNAFAEQFRSLVAKITRDTAEGLDLGSPSSSPNFPRTRSRIRTGPSSAPSSGAATPQTYARGSLGVPHPFSGSYPEAEEFNPYERDTSFDSDSSGEEDIYPHLAGVPDARYTFAPGFGDPVPYSALPGTQQQQQQEHIRILGSYVRRMSTIESFGSRERQSIYSTSSFGALRDRGGGGYDSPSLSDAGGPTGTLGRAISSGGGGEGGRTQSLRSVGMASLTSASLSFSGSAQGSVAGTRPPTRTGTLASVTTTENVSVPSRSSTGGTGGDASGPSRSSTNGSHYISARSPSSATPSPVSAEAPPLPTPSIRSVSAPRTSEDVIIEEENSTSSLASNSFHSLLEAAGLPTNRLSLDTSLTPTTMVADRLNDSPTEDVAVAVPIVA